MEPIDPPLRVPTGGWPKAMLRLELTTPCTRDEAVYELACLSRQQRRGCVAHFNGIDLFAWPHQSVSEIGRTYDRLRDSLKAGGLPPIIVERWTPLRKLEVLNAISSGAMQRTTALQMYGLSEEEMQSWETGLHTRGIDGLAVQKLQDGGRP
jgi:hypothetical protein